LGKSSSSRAYFYGETELVRVKFQEWALEIKCRALQSFAEVGSLSGAPGFAQDDNFFKGLD